MTFEPAVTGLLENEHLLDHSMPQGGIHAFTPLLATNLPSRGTPVNAVAAGTVWTPLNHLGKGANDVSGFGNTSR